MVSGVCSIYAFDESHEGYANALRLLFGEVKRRWPEVTTLSVLNWVRASNRKLEMSSGMARICCIFNSDDVSVCV